MQKLAPMVPRQLSYLSHLCHFLPIAIVHILNHKNGKGSDEALISSFFFRLNSLKCYKKIRGCELENNDFSFAQCNVRASTSKKLRVLLGVFALEMPNILYIVFV